MENNPQPPFLNKIWKIGSSIVEDEEANNDLNEYPGELRQLLYNRGIRTKSQAEHYLHAFGSLYDPFLMLNMERAVERIVQAIDNNELIAVYGDYDVDGVTATALLVQVLQDLGGKARRYIPNRFEEGYGLNIEAIKTLADEGIKLIITVDCGIRSPEEADFSREQNVDMIISDHHEPKIDLPKAVAILCPKIPGDNYPEKNLSGVGLAYKIAQALYTVRKGGPERADEWLDLVAAGTVADVVPLVGENRALVRKGLGVIRTGKRQGMVSLVGAAKGIIQNVTSRDIGFMIGPRLNAAGRLDSAEMSYQLLMAADLQEASVLAQQLDDHNKTRQNETRGMFEKAQVMIDGDGNAPLCFAVSEDFKMGIVGLVASRLTEARYRPSIVGAQAEEFTRASCRSIPEFHITKALDECADLFERYGGHAMAAGFTVRNERLPELKMRLEKIASDQLNGLDLVPVLLADMEISFKDLNPREVMKWCEAIEPTGAENPEIVFVTRNVKVLQLWKVGADKKHLKMKVSDGTLTNDAIAFRLGDWADCMPEKIDLMYTCEKNVYQGRESFQLNVRDLKPSEAN